MWIINIWYKNQSLCILFQFPDKALAAKENEFSWKIFHRMTQVMLNICIYCTSDVIFSPVTCFLLMEASEAKARGTLMILSCCWSAWSRSLKSTCSPSTDFTLKCRNISSIIYRKQIHSCLLKSIIPRPSQKTFYLCDVSWTGLFLLLTKVFIQLHVHESLWDGHFLWCRELRWGRAKISHVVWGFKE